MKSLDDIKNLAARFKKGPTDIVGLDVSDMGVNAVRMKKGGDGSVSLLSLDVLPAITVPKAGEEHPPAPIAIPSKLKARYASLATAGETAVIKLLSFPGRFDEAAEAKVVENMGLNTPDNYRVSYKLITEGHGKEARVLAVALLETDASSVVQLLPSGHPVPFSLEVSGLATMSAFLHAVGEQHKEDAIGLIDFGPKTTSFGLFNKNLLALIRRFPVGATAVLGKVQETLGVDLETAQGIISDGSFDISQSISEVMEPLLKQLIVSRDFVERRENCQLSKIYASGSLVVSRDLVEEIHAAVGVEVALWSPFQGITVAPGAIPDNLAGQEWRFTGAVGACLASFEET